MGKLLITFSDEQEAWLRREAERTCPAGVSELVRRAVDGERARRLLNPAPVAPCGKCGKVGPIEGFGSAEPHGPAVPLCGECF